MYLFTSFIVYLHNVKPFANAIMIFFLVLFQFWVAETNSFKLKLITYFSDIWNLVDIGTVILFVIGFTLRVVDHNQIVSQVCS